MMNVFAALLAGVLLGANPIAENSDEGFSLLKQSETCLYRPEFPGKPWSQNYSPRPLFARLPTGEIFMIEQSVSQRWVYFFAPDGKLQRIKKIHPGRKGKPGNITAVSAVFTTPHGEFGTCDNANRISLFSRDGSFLRSFLVPCFNGCSMRGAAIDYKTLALAEMFYGDKDRMLSRFILLDYENPEKGLISRDFCENAYDQADSKGKIVPGFIRQNVTALSSGQIACNVNTYPDIYLVSRDGKVISEDTVPPHFKALKDAEAPGIDDWSKIGIEICSSTSDECMPDTVEHWLATWTHSYGVYEYSSQRLVVPRVLYPTFYLDLYSYSDEKIEYLGYTSTDKQFLFADSSGVWLLEGKDDTCVVVGRYEIMPADHYSTRAEEWTNDSIAAEEALGIRKVIPAADTSDTCPECPKEKQYCTTIDSIKLVSANGGEYLLTDSLTPGKGHALVFALPQDCNTRLAVDSAMSYVTQNPGFDFTLIYTHPYPEELKEFIRLKRSYCDYPIITNTDKERLENVLRRSLCLLVVSKDGTIITRVE